MSGEANLHARFNLLGIDVGVEVPVEFQKWFRRSKADIVDRLYGWVRGEQKVTLKVSCYTLQTTLFMLLRLCAKFQQAKQFPDIHVKILRPDLSRSKKLRIWKQDDNDYGRAVRTAVRKSEVVRELISEQYPRVKFEETLFPFDPTVKAIIANDRVAFFGLYAAQQNRKSGGVTALDYVGTKTELIELRSGKGSESAVLEELVSWFDTTWKTFT